MGLVVVVVKVCMVDTRRHSSGGCEATVPVRYHGGSP